MPPPFPKQGDECEATWGDRGCGGAARVGEKKEILKPINRREVVSQCFQVTPLYPEVTKKM